MATRKAWEIGSEFKRQEAWRIFHSAPAELSKWEFPAGSVRDGRVMEYGGGLLLPGCPHCGAFATRETYVSGRGDASFWTETIELITDYSCAGIAQCKCGGYSHWVR